MFIAVMAPLAITIGALLLAMKLLRRVRDANLGSSALPLKVLQRVGCGPRQDISLVQVGQRVLVLSVSEAGSRLLTELDEEDAAVALQPAPPATLPAFRLPVTLTRLPVIARNMLSVLCVTVALSASPTASVAQDVPPSTQQEALVEPPPSIQLQVGDDETGLQINGTVGVVVLMSVMTLLPAVFLMMTSFTRILVVLHFLRSALGTQSAPPGQLLVAVAVLLTGVVMAPTLERANSEALQPYLDGQMSQVDAYRTAIQPFRQFMLANTRDSDLAVFAEMAGHVDIETPEDIPTVTVMSAFVMSELKTAFQIGFVIFLPFTVVDLVVASVLMSMGMFMLPPVMISLPFKLLLFVLADGWTLVVQNLVASFTLV